VRLGRPGDLFVTLPRLRAPQADGAILAEPPLDAVTALVEANRRQAQRPGPDLAGRSLAEVRALAVREVLDAARRYFTDAGEPLPAGADSASSVLVAGHQPELFHPGVWVKNFALNRLARTVGAAPLNLVVDNDTAKSTALRVPSWPRPSPEPERVHLTSVPFDHFTGEVAYEERPVQDESLFASLPDRVGELTANWGFRPLLHDLWPDVLRQRDRTPLLGERLAAARRALERRWDCHNLELPLSHLCRTEAFACFAVTLIGDPGFRNLYNNCVHDYRRRHGIRSSNHPVPDLAVDGDWHETPFWAWRAGSQRRQRLFARRGADCLQLRAGDERWPGLSLADPVAAWRRLEPEGYKVRTRALTTTFFARLCLADLFIHGIGGGKYDELTDTIARAYVGRDLPAFLILSGTLRLPLPHFPTDAERLRALAHEARDLHWNPQRHLPDRVPDQADYAQAVAEKQDWIRRQPTSPAEQRQRFQTLRDLTERLREPLRPAESALAEELCESQAEAHANDLLRRRDFAFCLFPEPQLRAFCTQFL
jgi:hypothetical protein